MKCSKEHHIKCFNYFGLVQNKELLIPENECVEGPDFLHVECLAVLVVIEKLHQLFGDEELFGDLTLEGFFYLIVELILTQPVAERYGETELLLVCGAFRHLLDRIVE